MGIKNNHEVRMRRCLQLAQNAIGMVSPNPMVGCVIVYRGKVIGEGYHQKYGGSHAEVNAIASVKEKDKFGHSELYVNLEPCSHHGKTPPCTELIIKSGIKKVVIGCSDPFYEVNGRGIQQLKAAGVDVQQGILEKDALELNRRFFTFHNKKRPYIILKWAQTSDGFIDILREPGANKSPTWITNAGLKPLVHKWRTEEDAIMVGTQTALMDNPQLTAREWAGKNPLRIAIDKDLSLPANINLFDGSTPTIVLNGHEARNKNNLEYIKLDFSYNILQQLMDQLHQRNVQSLIVEGGRKLLQSFIESGLWDEARVFTGNIQFGKGISAPDFPYIPKEVKMIAADKLSIFRNL